MIMFSVIIPLYNKADTISRAIHSVWNQKFAGYELIVVNDGSTDDSLSIVSRLSEVRPILIINKTNGGVSSARNTGAEKAQGRYLAFLDADDWWEEGYLVEIAAMISLYPDAVCLGTGFYFYQAGHLWRTRYSGRRKRSVLEATAIFQPLHTSSIAIKRECFNVIGGFNLKYGFYEDLECFFRLELAFPQHTYISGRPLSHHMDDALYSITKNSASSETPHIGVVETALSSNLIIGGGVIKRFAWRYALFRLSNNSRMRRPDRNKQFYQEYPMIVGQVRAWKLFASERMKLLAWGVSIIVLFIRYVLVHSVIAPVKDCKCRRFYYYASHS